MNCTELESALADYLDGTLEPAQQAALDAHAASCSGCREFLQDVTAGVAFLKRVPDIAPPAELITRIAYQAPMGRIRQPFERQSIFSKILTRWLQPLLQPRLAMGMAMTILSFAMLERCTGVKVQHIQAADLNPVRIWGGTEDKLIRLKDRAVKYYENIRLVYDIETRLKRLEDQQEAAQNQAPQTRRSAGESNPRMKNNNAGASAPTQGEKKK